MRGSYLARTEKMGATQFQEMANHASRLLGVSETSSDMRDLLDREARDGRAAEAVALFCYQVKKWIGAFTAALGGLDTLVFAGGIGENAAPVRARICDGLLFLASNWTAAQCEECIADFAGFQARHSAGYPHRRGADDREVRCPCPRSRINSEP